jgi:hypothetical protein
MRGAIALTLVLTLVAASGIAGCGTSSIDKGAPDSGSGSSGGEGGIVSDGGGDDVSPEAAALPIAVTVFDKQLFAFDGAPGGLRRTTAPASFPTGGTYASVSLHLQLDCPAGGCDHWDRAASLGIVTEAPVDGGSHGKIVEIARWITPFGVAAGWDVDVSDLAPMLSGAVTLQGFIDTWSPQGDAPANGAGWLLTTTFTFTPGTPAGKTPIADIPLWTWPADSDPSTVPYGDPSKPLSMYVQPAAVTLPAGASSYALRSFITGHGQGSTDNCAEFCKATHTVTVGATPFATTPWRTCCIPEPQCELQSFPKPAPGVAPGQLGSYRVPRSGWCPGSAVNAWTQDVTAAIASSSMVTFTYGLDGYVNGCRAELEDAGTCDHTQCALGTECTYDGLNHTEPVFYISSLLVAYR